MDVELKSIGFLIDELMTTSNKIWHMQDSMVDMSLPPEQRAQFALNIQILNTRRNKLIAAIDKRFGEGLNPATLKTYENIGK